MSLSTPFLCCQDALDFSLRLSQGRLQQNSVALNAALAVLEAKEQWRLVLQACEAGDSKICLDNFAFPKRQGTLSRFEGNYVFEYSGRSQDACVYLNVIFFLVDSRYGRIARFGYMRFPEVQAWMATGTLQQHPSLRRCPMSMQEGMIPPCQLAVIPANGRRLGWEEMVGELGMWWLDQRF